MKQVPAKSLGQKVLRVHKKKKEEERAYRISVLAEDRQRGLIYADRIRRFCMENGIFLK